MFKGLFGGKSSGGSKGSGGNSSNAKLSPALRDTILSVVGQRAIAPMPGTAQKAFALSTNPKAEARDFIELIEVDEALSARVIKIANSVFFDRGKKSNTIEEAVVVIGLDELRSLLTANALSDIFPSSNQSRIHLWNHDVAVALISKQLANRIQPRLAESAFLAGLMHDVGKLLLLQRCSNDYQKIMQKVEESGCDFRNAEVEVFPFDHCQVGQLIAERWNFSEDLVSAISNHHQQFESMTGNDGNCQLAAIVHCSDIIAHSLGLGFPAKYARLKANSQERLFEIWALLKVPAQEGTQILERSRRTFETEQDLYSGKGGL